MAGISARQAKQERQTNPGKSRSPARLKLTALIPRRFKSRFHDAWNRDGHWVPAKKFQFQTIKALESNLMDKPLLPQTDKEICHALFFAQDSTKSKKNTVSNYIIYILPCFYILFHFIFILLHFKLRTIILFWNSLLRRRKRRRV